MHLPARDASNFDCSWEVSVRTSEGQQVSAALWKTAKRDPTWAQVLENGWFLFNIGSVEVASLDQIITVHSIGGNPNWFSDLELDCVVLRPILKDSMNQRQGNIESNNQIIHPPKPTDTGPQGVAEESDNERWGFANAHEDLSDGDDAEEDESDAEVVNDDETANEAFKKPSCTSM
jgi:hypothetical protein